MRLVLLSLLLLAMGCNKNRGDGKEFHFSGTVLDISSEKDRSCHVLLFKKDDGTMVQFNLRDWPPAWKGMHGEILLESDDFCGYVMISAREK